MKLLITSLLLLTSFNLFATPTTEIVSIETGSGRLEGTLLSDDLNNAKAVALIIAGSGPTDRDGNNPAMKNNSLKMLADELLKVGISSLRYDKRGIGHSKDAGLNEIDLRFENYIDDAKSWIEYLHNLDRFKQIVVIGHSEGSLIGMVAAQQKNVDKFVSIAGAGQPIDQILREQLKAQPPVVLEQSTPILDKLLQGQTVENVPPFLNGLFRPSVQPYMISWFKYDPQKEISKLQKPVLIVQGTSDIQVSLADADKLAAANQRAKKVVIENMNHIFKPSPLDKQANVSTYNQPDLPIKPELISAVSEFIQN
ncbi:alpha/beta fold hydrolase [Shewanella sp. Isolate11]|uniref:alpha/beta hydrolase n=1 Tax=Shewanella sp. Isolate11 TaxID=2908530 RepID=UPI001EFDE239|nr:alpha/beta fold hydrolase [Shewanella sp. Isolate11]MCG9695921.1 lysophospholipase [Shewanella sp. Isolate11]